MRKTIIILIVIALCLSLFSACDLDEKPIELESSMDIPEDGIIPASVFKKLKDENKIITFCGKSGETGYEWTVFGNDIETPQDTNLKITVADDRVGSISFTVCSEEKFSFTPVLSLHSSCFWDSDSAVVTHEGKTLCSASVTGSKTSVLNFSVTGIGSYTITAEKAPEEIPEYIAPEEEKVPEETLSETKPVEADPYLSESASGTGHTLSDGKQTGQDQYQTDPVPAGKPLPVEPENQNIDDTKSFTCTFSIECSTIFNNLDQLNADKLDALPSDGVIFPKTSVTFYEGESVYDVLQRVCKENNIHMEASWTPIYNSAYVEGIHNLYEFDCGTGSGWMYRVNGWYPNYGCSRYQLAQGDNVEWRYTCDLGADVGGGYAIGG